MVETIEVEHEFQDGYMVYTKTWKPDSPAKAKLIFVHGYSDHCNRYNELFSHLASKSIEVFSFDQRGWGRSIHTPSQKGLTGPTSLMISDLVHIITAQLTPSSPSPTSNIPVFVMGYSMGGAEILTLASSPEHSHLTGKIRGWLTESAHIAFTPTAQPSNLTILLGRLANPIIPHYPLENKSVSVTMLSRDPSIQKSLANDPLCHNIGTLQCLSSVFERARDLDSGKRMLNANVGALWMGHGLADLCSSWEGSRRFCEMQRGVGDRVFRGYEGVGHQIHGDLPEVREEFAGDVAGWILERSGVEE